MKQYVIIQIGNKYALKQKILPGFFGPGLFLSRDINKVKDFATENNMNVIAIGDIYEV